MSVRYVVKYARLGCLILPKVCISYTHLEFVRVLLYYMKVVRKTSKSLELKPSENSSKFSFTTDCACTRNSSSYKEKYNDCACTRNSKTSSNEEGGEQHSKTGHSIQKVTRISV